MLYTIVEIVVYLAVAALLGFWLGVLFQGRRNEADLEAAKRAARAREEGLLGVWRRKLADCEKRRDELEALIEAAPGGDAGAGAKQMVQEEAAEVGKEKKEEGERPARKKDEAARKSGKTRGAGGKRGQAIAASLQGLDVDLPQNTPGGKPTADTAIEDDAARQRVRNVVARAGGALPEDEQLDRETAREEVKALVKRMDGTRKPPHDNLKKIYGIGPKFEKMLNELGITSYQQLARMKKEEIQILATAIDAFPDRVERDNWVEGAIKAYEKKYGKAPG